MRSEEEIRERLSNAEEALKTAPFFAKQAWRLIIGILMWVLGEDLPEDLKGIVPNE